MLRVKTTSLSGCRKRVAIALFATVAMISMRAAHADAVSVVPADSGVVPVAKAETARGGGVTTEKGTGKNAGSSLADELQPIVVTANRRAENSQDVGAAITTESGLQIQALNITRAEDLVKLSPGVSAIPNNVIRKQRHCAVIGCPGRVASHGLAR